MSWINPHFFIRPYHVKEEDNALIDKEMKQLCYLGILKKISAYSSPVMLISRKLTKDKRVVIDFRHQNERMAKNSLAYPLVKDTILVLGSSKCQVLLVFRFKRCIPLLEIIRKLKEVLRDTFLLW